MSDSESQHNQFFPLLDQYYTLIDQLVKNARLSPEAVAAGEIEDEAELAADHADYPSLQTGPEEGSSLSENLLVLRKLIHNLGTYQIELEMQNEELRSSRIAQNHSQTKYMELYKRAPVGYLTLNTDGFIQELNPAAAKILGKSPANLYGMQFLVFLSSDTAPLFQRHLEQVLASKTAQECEVTLFWQNRAPIPLYIQSAVINDEVVPEIGVTLIDITALKHAEEVLITQRSQLETQADAMARLNTQLRREVAKHKQTAEALRFSENRYRRLVENGPDIIYQYDLDGGGIYFSPQVEEILGYSPEYLQQHPWLWQQSIHPDDLPRVQKVIARFKEGHSFELEYRIADASGREHWFLDRSINRHEPGTNLVIEGAAIDITRRKLAENELETHRRRLEAILEGTNVGTWEWNVQTGETIFNERWAEIIGYTLAEISPTSVETWLEYVHPQDLKISDRLLRKHFSGELDSYKCEVRMHHKAGRWVWVLSRGKVSTWTEDGRPLLMSGTHYDITERKQMEESLRQAKETAEAANRAKSAFLSNMSHELRTPLNGILGYTQIFKQDSGFSSRQQEGIDIIHRSGEHLLTMINDILDVSKIEANRMELVMVEFDFSHFLQTIVEMIRMRAAQKGLQLIFQPAANLPSQVVADETRLRQVLLNLLGNAIKFTDQGSVNFSVKSKNTVAPPPDGPGAHPSSGSRLFTFEVVDTGSGIPPHQREQIFEPFLQIGDAQDKFGGTGLGLSISQKLVQLMGGQLRVESAGPTWQSGSRFWFDIPLKADNSVCSTSLAEVAPARVTGYRRTHGKGPFTVLLADDEKANRVLLRKILTPVGFELLHAEDGQEAVTLAEQRLPDLIFMDLVMPHQDGLTATRRIRQNPALEKTPIIAFSASVDGETRRKSQLVGCSDFLNKPFAIAEVLDAVRRHLPLVWLYNNETAPTNESLRPQMMLPPPTELHALLRLTAIGDVMEIETRANDLVAHEPAYTPFATHLRQLTNNFAVEELEQFIRQCLEEQ